MIWIYKQRGSECTPVRKVSDFGEKKWPFQFPAILQLKGLNEYIIKGLEEWPSLLNMCNKFAAFVWRRPAHVSGMLKV